MMGMLLPEDEELLWIAEESLLAPLPEGTSKSGREMWRPAMYVFARRTVVQLHG